MSEPEGIIDSLLGCTNDILGVRDSMGAALKSVKIVSRRWSGGQIGSGDLEETIVDVLPTPGFKSYSQDLRVQEGGMFKQGDIVLRSISKQSFPTQLSVSCKTTDPGIEKFYRCNDEDYRVISVLEKHLTWDVQLRKITQ